MGREYCYELEKRTQINVRHTRAESRGCGERASSRPSHVPKTGYSVHLVGMPASTTRTMVLCMRRAVAVLHVGPITPGRLVVFWHFPGGDAFCTHANQTERGRGAKCMLFGGARERKV
jgi:hypothetical protein